MKNLQKMKKICKSRKNEPRICPDEDSEVSTIEHNGKTANKIIILSWKAILGLSKNLIPDFLDLGR